MRKHFSRIGLGLSLLLAASSSCEAASLEDLDREHLLMLVGSGIDLWQSANAEILVGQVPWFVDAFVTVPEDVVIRASRIQNNQGSAVVTLRGDEARFRALLQQLEAQGWTKRAVPQPHPLSYEPPLSFCRDRSALSIWKARTTAEGLDLKIVYSVIPTPCQPSSSADAAAPSTVTESLGAAIGAIPVPAGGDMVGENQVTPGFNHWTDWSWTIHTTASLAETLDHYASRLQDQGWRKVHRQAGSRVGLVVFDSVERLNRSLGAVLVVVQDDLTGARKRLDLRVHLTPGEPPA